MFCANCGGQVAEGTSKCSSCGQETMATKAMESAASSPSSSFAAAATKPCPYCGQPIPTEAIRCRHCQAALTAVPYGAGSMAVHGPTVQGGAQPTIVIQNVQTQTPQPQAIVPGRYKNPAVAVLLAFLFPGAGQFYNGHAGKGLIVLFTFWLVIPWIWSIFDAYNCAHRINRVGY